MGKYGRMGRCFGSNSQGKKPFHPTLHSFVNGTLLYLKLYRALHATYEEQMKSHFYFTMTSKELFSQVLNTSWPVAVLILE